MARPTSLRTLVLGGLCAAALAAPTRAAAQEGCEFGEGSGDLLRQTLPGVGQVTYMDTPHLLCDDDVEIWADSAVAYSEAHMVHFMGRVRYEDRSRQLRADTARYFSGTGRLQAEGSLVVEDAADGSRIEDGSLVYLRQTSTRREESMTVTTGRDGRRPRALVPPARPADAPPTPEPPAPYEVVADRLLLRGQSSFTAVGTVEITRDSLLAFADSVEFDEAEDHLLLDRQARVVTGGNELVGRVITIGSPGADSSRIHALRDAVLTGDDMLLTAPQIFVFLTGGEVDRLVAIPIASAVAPELDAATDGADLARPIATVQDFELTADSLEVLAPNDVVERVFAVGRARSVSTSGDSLNVEILPDVARSDWLLGDTVIVTFRRRVAEVAIDAPAAATDTVPPPSEGVTPGPAEPDAGSERYEVDRIVARVDASALYRLPPSDSTAVAGTDPPALHYVVGSEITITMAGGEVDQMQVVGQTRGIHLEPVARRSAPLDSTATTDSAGVARDTTAVGEPSAGPTYPEASPHAPGPHQPDRRTPTSRPNARMEESWRPS